MKKMNYKGFGIIPTILVLVIISGSVGVAYMLIKNRQSARSVQDGAALVITNFDECVKAGNPVMESFPEQCAANGRTFTNEAAEFNNGYNTTVTSGQGAFEITFPDGFGEVIKPLDSDAFYLMGMQQPEIKQGGAIAIKEMEGFGTDAASLFAVLVHDNFAEPVGAVEDYTLINGKENPIKGKKYVKIYEQDEEYGIGYQRYKGDRDYEYVFPLGSGKELRVFYHVYGVDPRNNTETIEAIIDTIRLKK